VLPFSHTPPASVAGQTSWKFRLIRRHEPRRLPADALDIVIILLDVVGLGLPDTFGGVVHSPTLSPLASMAGETSQYEPTSTTT
jgi:hypothetical protein